MYYTVILCHKLVLLVLVRLIAIKILIDLQPYFFDVTELPAQHR